MLELQTPIFLGDGLPTFQLLVLSLKRTKLQSSKGWEGVGLVDPTALFLSPKMQSPIFLPGRGGGWELCFDQFWSTQRKATPTIYGFP